MSTLRIRYIFVLALIMGFPFIDAQDIKCETYPSNPVSVGEDIVVNCTSKGKEIDCKDKTAKRPNQGNMRSFQLPILISNPRKEERLEHLENDCNKSCAFKILKTTFEDDGEWTIKLDENTAEIILPIKIVQNPSAVYFQIPGPIKVGLKNNPSKKIPTVCLAKDTRPTPKFEWLINGKPINAKLNIEEPYQNQFQSKIEIEVTREKLLNVTCQAYHILPKKTDSVMILPQFYPYDFEPTTFYSLKSGELNRIEMSFKASPEPKVAEISLKFDDQKVDFSMRNLTQAGEFQYILTLEFKLKSEWIEKDGILSIGNFQHFKFPPIHIGPIRVFSRREI